MARTKFLNALISIMVIVSLTFGGNYTKVSAQQRITTPPQGKTKTQKPPLPPVVQPTPPQRKLTPAERQAAADRARALGQLPGVAQSQLPSSGVSKPVSINMPDSSVTPHYFGPYANYANSPMPKGAIASITVDAGGSGYSSITPPTVYVLDAYGTGLAAVAEAVVDVNGVITAINVIDGGADYTAPIVVIEDTTGGTGAAATPILGSLTGGIRKFMDSLPGLGAGAPNNLGNYIPVGAPDKVTYGPDFVATHPHPDARPSDYYEIALVEFTQQLHRDLPPTTLRGYVQLETAERAAALLAADPNYVHVQLFYPDGSPIYYADGTTPVFAVDQPRYLGPTIVAASDTPVRVKFYNFLPTGEGGDLFIPTDTTVMGAGEGPKGTGIGAGPAYGADCDPMLDACEMYTENRATLHLHGGLVPWISDGTPHQWITPAGENTQYPEGVSVSDIPDMPTPEDGSMTFYYNNAQGARLMFYHDHAYGLTRLNVYAGEAAGYVITDQVEEDLIAGTNDTGVNPGLGVFLPGVGTPIVLQDKSFVDATTIGAQDPTWKWGTGPFINGVDGRREPKTGDLWLPSVYMPIQNPNDLAGGNAFGRWQYGPWFNPPTANITNGPMDNPYYDPGCDNATTWCEPQYQPNMPTPSMGMEAYMDTSMVNGAVYPYLEVDPTTVRFRVLNAANDRFYNLQMYVAVDANDQPCTAATTPAAETSGVSCTEVRMVPAAATPGFPELWPADGRAGGAPDPALAGPEWIQIGTEGGFLPAPVVIPQQPITWQGNPGFFNVGNVLDHSLLLGNAERADVLVDFSAYAGKTLILYNDAPTAFPALDPRYDYYTGNPSQMDSGGAPATQRGYGPNTRTVMQIRVKNVAPSATYDVTALETVWKKNIASGKAGVFEAAHPGETPIIPQAAYNSAYDASFPSDALSQYVQIGEWEKTFTPIGQTTPVTITFETKAIHDEMGGVYDTAFGRMSGMLGLDIPQPNSLNQNIILTGYASPPVDVLEDTTATQIGVLGDGTQIWKIMHNGVDTHPIHWHMFNLQLINRVGWDGLLMPPEANELGWKETIRVNPLEDTIVAMRPKKANQPFEVPNSIRPIDPTKPIGVELDRGMQGILTPGMFNTNALNHMINYGWEYVWHCHILSHEEMDMMHSMAVAVKPSAPSGLTVIGEELVWTDNSVNETEWTIQRTAGGVVSNFSMPSISGPQTGDLVGYTDTGAPVGSSYVVFATNVVGDTFVYDTAPGAKNFPVKTVSSGPSSDISNALTVTSIVRASTNPTSAQSVDFTVTFSEAVTTPVLADFDVLTNSTVTSPSVTAVTGSGAIYTVTVDTGGNSGVLHLDMTNTLLGGPFTTGEFYVIEKTAPAVVSFVRASADPSSGAGVNYTVTFDKPVTGVDASDFSPVTTGVFTAAPVVTKVAGTGAVYTVTVASYKSNSGTLGLDLVDDNTIKDLALSALGGPVMGDGNYTGPIYVIDNVAPTVVSSVRTSASPTGAASVTFTVTFSEAVTGVDNADFSLSPTVTGASVTSVSGTGDTRTVTVNTGTGAGTLRLNVSDNDTIADGLFNPLNGLKTGTTFSTGEAYKIRTAAPGIVDDASDLWTYSGAWTSYNGSGPYLDTLHYSSTIGDSAQIGIEGGQQIKLTYLTADTRGITDVYIDNVKVASIDAYSPTFNWQVTWTSGVLASGTHTLRLVHASGSYTDLDSLEVIATPASLLPGIADDGDPLWSYSGTWAASNGAGPYLDTIHYSGTIGDSAQIVISGGQQIKLTYLKADNRGVIDVYVDGVKISSIDAYSPLFTWQATWTSGILASGFHTVQFVHASGAYVDIDALEVIATPASLLPGIADDSDVLWNFSGAWTAYAGAGPYSDTLHYSSTIGDSAQIVISGGQQIKLTYLKADNRGVIDVYIDDVKVASIDGYAPVFTWQATWTSGILTSGLHTVRFVHASGAYTDIDALEVIATPASLLSGIADDSDSLWSYTGAWTTYAAPGPYLDTLHYSSTIGDSAEIIVNGGKQVKLTYLMAGSRGVINVYVDGVMVDFINAYSPVFSWQTTWTSGILASGLHTVSFVHASGSYIDIDAIEVLP